MPGGQNADMDGMNDNTTRDIVNENEEQLAVRLDDAVGMDRLLKALKPEPEDPERWDGLE